MTVREGQALNAATPCLHKPAHRQTHTQKQKHDMLDAQNMLILKTIFELKVLCLNLFEKAGIVLKEGKINIATEHTVV